MMAPADAGDITIDVADYTWERENELVPQAFYHATVADEFSSEPGEVRFSLHGTVNRRRSAP
jgi:hypothetical protein